MNISYLSLGSNIEPRIMFFAAAEKYINEIIGKIITKSSIYETDSWGFTSNNFLNQVVKIETKLTPVELLISTQNIENIIGRKEKTKTNDLYSSRVIDIDILFYNDIILNTETLKIPHEHMHKRKFVLVLLNEIAPNFIHPFLNETIISLLKNCNDKLSVKKFN